MLESGTLSDRLTFLQPPTTVNGYNEPTGAWVSYYSCWGSVKPAKGSQEYQADVVTAASTYKVSIRSTKSVTFNNNDRIQLKDGTLLRIETPLRVPARFGEISFMCLAIDEST